MLKKLCFALILFWGSVMLFSNFTKATATNLTTTNKIQNNLTEKQKALLEAKKIELKKHYFKDWDSKTPEEKQKAKANFVKEIEKFCKDKLGVSYDEIRVTRKKPYFKRYS